MFDELYSGTNPEEAVESASGFLNHLSSMNNVNYILTTHYTKLCKKVDKNVSKNYYMDIKKNEAEDDYIFTYKMKKGIRKVKKKI